MLSLCLQPPPATHWTNGHWVYWPMKESARTSQRKENVISLSECFQVLFVNLINWVNILARFYEKLSWGISIENISFCWRPARLGGIFCLGKYLDLRVRCDVTDCCKNKARQERTGNTSLP